MRMQWFVANYLTPRMEGSAGAAGKMRVLDVGSYDVNGSYKQFFNTPCYDYTGLDMEAGPNVDIVPSSPYAWKEIETDAFDVVVSGQALEHIEFFWLTVSEMVRVLRKDGILCLIAPNGFAEHRYPVDCYRFFTDGMIALARYTNLDVLHAHTDCQPSIEDSGWHIDNREDSMLIARKPYSGSSLLIDVHNYVCRPAELDIARDPLVPHQRNPLPTGIIHRAYRKIGRLIGSI
jgi:SAM-dependent methyltransferase